jgi:hypothetical protein
MDQIYQPYRLQTLIEAFVAAVDAAQAVDRPFFHLEFEEIFPATVYAAMTAAMPSVDEYRRLPGRHRENVHPDGTLTRVKLDLFPEYIRHLDSDRRPIWEVVGRALASAELRSALIRRLAPGLARRFGKNYAKVGMYPVPILTRDSPGYRITPHTDTKWKGMTVQIYLPRDASAHHLGTIFHGRAPSGQLTEARRMRFVPNCGYAFAVGGDTWHSVDPVGEEVAARDSILLTYFIDEGPLRIMRNRGSRLGNFLLNEARHLRPRR